MNHLALLLVLLPQFSLAADAVKLALNWKPEPEFGGFYDAKVSGIYKKAGLDVDILEGGAGQPVVQMVAAGKVEYGIVGADEIVIARSHGADVVGLYAVYEINPMAIMVHASQGFKGLSDLFRSNSTLAIEKGLPYTQFLLKKYGGEKLKLVPYTGGVGVFLHDSKFAQQCFITSEPLQAKNEGADPQTFLVADSGYNPYTTVLAVKGDYLKKHHDQVAKFVRAVRDGWTEYLKDPTAANKRMNELNSGMDLPAFNAVAVAQKDLIQTKETNLGGLGSMTLGRWQDLISQMKELKALDQAPPKAQDCFKQF